jgi:Fe-S-cluster containining protein
MTGINIQLHNENVKKYKSENKKIFNKLKKKTPKSIHQEINNLHNNVFKKIDCLTCANCCKTTPPIITNRDIERISKHLRLKQGQFMEKYILMDNDGDYIFKITPCTFLDENNYCMIYDVRPKACREYPHTDANKISLKLMEKNITVCPAVFEMVDGLKR